MPLSIMFIMALATVIAGVAIGFLIQQVQMAKLNKALSVERDAHTIERESSSKRIDDLQGRLLAAESDRARLAEKEKSFDERLEDFKAAYERQLRERKDALDERGRFLDEAEVKLKETFAAISLNSLKQANEELVRAAKSTFEAAHEKADGDLKLRHQKVEELLRPFAETMKSLNKRCEDTEKQSMTSHALLMKELERLSGATEAFSRALQRPHSRGSWGEGTLRNVLEQSGLQEGVDYELQHSTDTDDGKLRADAVINLPRGRRIVIDAKNLWDGYQQAVAETDDTMREALLQKHCQAVRQQIKQLSGKEYWKQYDGLDCVLMFLPTEGMFHAALENDADLQSYAIENRVYMASPMSLVGFLRAISYVLDQEKSNKNAEEIRGLGKKLHEALHVFGAHYAKVGESLGRTVDTYNKSISSLERNVLSKARQLKAKGAGSSQEIEEPPSISVLPVTPRILQPLLPAHADDAAPAENGDAAVG